MGERTWTVAEIGARIAQVVDDRMGSRFWVRGEVADLSRTARGMVFLSLVQTDDRGHVVARLSVTASPGKGRLADRRMSRVGQPLTDGIEIRIRGHLDYYAPGGRLSLSMDDIDPAHTAGAMAIARRELLDALAVEGLLQTNAQLPTPRLPLRVGLITRSGSQAYHDVLDELRASGLPFDVVVASAAVQGVHAPAELAGALVALGGRQDLDLLLLTRGGGGDVDLSTFDHPAVARAVATAALPVWTGIGHHLDTPVSEQVAARSLKTPTALAQAVVTACTEAVADVEGRWARITSTADRQLGAASARLDTATRRTQSARLVLRGAVGRLDASGRRLEVAGHRAIGAHHRRLDDAGIRLRHAATGTLTRAAARLDVREGLVEAGDPARLLARGWSLTSTVDGALVTGPVPTGTRLRTTTRSGIITSEVVDDDG
jgi:exodeoxyribonuclease VII large subunit